ncbi:unnamed protein product [Oikopleura dioica]|uniref:Trafficking protein particle complex subunit 11 domain-containing protein n=1 Tax=Oikopleura dioica TaxID=34765 RepID=E4X3W4_OIKDI|nr:unnamed protein product [Oikopleura dioica]
MLTQYLENAKCKFYSAEIILIYHKIVGAKPHWLETLLKSDITRWDSFQLEPNYTLEQVEKIANRTASLLDLRNYLFSRRARLLSQLQLHEELAKASLVYVSGTFQELSSLTNIKPQFIRTWAVLAGFSAFQLVERADALTSEGHTRITTNGAALLDLARGHLFKLGDALGLAEGSPAIEDIEPLIAGFVSLAVESDQERRGPDDPNGNGEQSLAAGRQEITSRLEMALSSPSKFEAFYLNICSKTMHEFKRVGRVRTAILVGRDLAKFHCRRGNFEKAEELLLELLELFRIQLVSKELVELHQITGHLVKEASVYYSLSAASNDYFRMFYETISDVKSAQTLQYSLEQVGRPLWAHCTPSSRVDIKDQLKIQFELYCLFDLGQITAEVWLEEVSQEANHDFSMLTPSAASNSMIDVFSIGKASTALSIPTSYATSGNPMDFAQIGRFSSNESSDDGFFTHNNLIQFNDTGSVSGPDLRYFAHIDQRSNRTRMVGISSPALRRIRNKKGKSLRSTSAMIEQPQFPSPSLRSNPREVNLLKGANKLEFDVDSTHSGRYSISRLCLFYELEGARAEMISSQLDPPVHIEVMDSVPVLTMNLQNENLYAGVSSRLEFSILVGSRSLENETITFIVSRGLKVLSEKVHVNIKSPNSKCTQKNTLDLERWSNQLTLQIPFAAKRSEVTFSLDVRCPLHADDSDFNGLVSDNGSLIEEEGASEDEDTETGSDHVKQHHVNIELQSSAKHNTFNLNFMLPFVIKTFTYSKFLSLKIQNRSSCSWRIKAPVARLLPENNTPPKCLDSLSSTDEFQLLPSQGFDYLWQLPPSPSPSAAISEFVFCFELEAEEIIYKYEHYEMLNCLKPMYRVQYDSKSLDHATGLLPLTIKVKRCYPTERGETDAISWHIADDRSAWGISGLTSGVMHFGAEHNLLQCIKVDLMPLFMGDLRLPILSLRRLVQKTSTSVSEHDSSISSMEGSYKGMKRVNLEEGDVEFTNPFDLVVTL